MSALARVAAACCALALFLHASVAAARGDAQRGRAKAAELCAACHGPDGAKPSTPDQPVLAGQYYDYLVRALLDYKAGKRNNAIMKGFAANLTQREIEDLAAWFAAQPGGLYDRR